MFFFRDKNVCTRKKKLDVPCYEFPCSNKSLEILPSTKSSSQSTSITSATVTQTKNVPSTTSMIYTTYKDTTEIKPRTIIQSIKISNEKGSANVHQSSRAMTRTSSTMTTTSTKSNLTTYDIYWEIEAHTDVPYTDLNDSTIDDVMIQNYFTVEEYQNQKQPLKNKPGKRRQNVSERSAAHAAVVLVVLIILIAVFVALIVVIVRRRSTLLKYVIPRLV